MADEKKQMGRPNSRFSREASAEMFDLLQLIHQRLMDGRHEVEKSDMDSWAEEIDDVLTRAERGES